MLHISRPERSEDDLINILSFYRFSIRETMHVVPLGYSGIRRRVLAFKTVQKKYQFESSELMDRFFLFSDLSDMLNAVIPIDEQSYNRFNAESFDNLFAAKNLELLDRFLMYKTQATKPVLSKDKKQAIRVGHFHRIHILPISESLDISYHIVQLEINALKALLPTYQLTPEQLLSRVLFFEDFLLAYKPELAVENIIKDMRY